MMFFVLSIVTSLWANGFQADPLSLMTDATARDALLRTQIQTLGTRVRQGGSCATLFAQVPGPNGRPVDFEKSFTLIESTLNAIKNEIPRECQLELAQNLQLAGPIGIRLSNEIVRFNSPQLASDTIFQCAPSTSPIRDLLGLLGNVTTATAYREMPIGQWALVNKSAAFYDNISYALRRDDNNSYRAVISLNFTGGQAGMSSADMMAKVRQCLNGAAPYLAGNVRGANISDGSRADLKIDLISWDEADRLPAAVRPRRNSISIAPTGARNNVRSFAQDISCDTVIHEVMHLLGLCDEYPGGRGGYPCRAVGRPTSIMRNESLAFAAAIPQKMSCDCNSAQCNFITATNRRRAYVLQPGLRDFTQADFLNQNCSSTQGTPTRRPIDELVNANTPRFSTLRIDALSLEIVYGEIEESPERNAATVVTEKRTCTCRPNDTDCIRQIDFLADEQKRREQRPTTIICPSGSQPLKAVVANNPFSSGLRVGPQGRTLELYSKPSRNSLLEPWHLNQIVNGNCAAKTNFYDSCAQLAYQRSPQRCEQVLQQGQDANRACLETYDWANYSIQHNNGTRCRGANDQGIKRCVTDRDI